MWTARSFSRISLDQFPELFGSLPGGIFDVSICAVCTFTLRASLIRANVVWPEDTMADYSHILFNKSPLQLRLLGARGGRAYGRNQRLRRALLPASSEAIPRRAAPQETTAKAIAALETQFPWLSGGGGHHQSR
jgi:hypothetical protein